MLQFTNPLKKIFLLIAFTLTGFNAISQKVSEPKIQPEWIRAYPPFRVAGNFYYVGTYELASYLIVTKQGLILINTGTGQSVPMICSSIRKLGFKVKDIKILLANHAHFDHVGGLAEIKKLTGAKLMVEEKDAPALADGGNSDYLFGGKGPLFAPVKADVLLRDRDIVKLGEMKITLLHTPGHTKGASSFMFDVTDEYRTYTVLIANMPTILDGTKLSGMANYPDVGKDYKYTLDVLKKQKFDIWLTPHASQFNLHQKYKPGDGYRPAAFIDRKGYDAALKDLKDDYLKRLHGN